jgi:RNA polymerase sigma factor (sigma-70 family)
MFAQHPGPAEAGNLGRPGKGHPDVGWSQVAVDNLLLVYPGGGAGQGLRQAGRLLGRQRPPLQPGRQRAAICIFQAQVVVAVLRTRRVDLKEVANSALMSFFRGYAGGKFELEGWDSLWEVLLVITLRKCGRRIEYFRTQRRSVLQDVQSAANPEDPTASWEAIAHEPTPEEAAVLNETVEQVLRSLHERERPILVLALQGYSLPEISKQTHRTERTVYRVLKRVREKLEELRIGGTGS